MEEKRHRFAIEVTNEQHMILKNNLPHGMQKIVFNIVIDDMCLMFNRYGQSFIVALMDNQLSYDSMVRKFIEKREPDETSRLEDSFQPSK